MSEQIRLRLHTDGRVAVYGPSRYWLVIGAQSHWIVNEPYISHSGWLELLVTELPEPDHWTDCAGPDGEDAITPQWEVSGGPLITAWIDGVETDDNGFEEDLDHIRCCALKMLAAVAACERYRTQREAKT